MNKTLRRILIGFGVLAVIAFVGNSAPLFLLIHLCLGWILFVLRRWGDLQVSQSGVMMAVIALALFLAGFQWMMRRAGAKVGDVPWRWNWTVATTLIVVLAFAAGTAMTAVVHQTVWWATSPEHSTQNAFMDSVHRSQSKTVFSHIAPAFEQQQKETGAMSTAGIFSEEGEALHSWMTGLLPYMDHQPMWDRIDQTRPWTDAVHRSVFQQPMESFQVSGLPHDRKTPDGDAVSDLAMNQHLVRPGRRLSLKQMTDGVSRTILLGQVSQNLRAWGDPVNWRDPGLGLNTSPDGFGSHWSGGEVIFLFADGRTQMLNGSTSRETLRALSTPSAGDTPGDF